MTGLSVLLLGVGLGLRHATDADHVVVVSALVQREPGIWRAARVAALWGLGHSAAFLAWDYRLCWLVSVFRLASIDARTCWSR